MLLVHAWPGNIRELENLMERSVLLSDGEVLRAEDLPGLSGPLIGDVPGGDEPAEELDGLGLKEYVRVHTAKLERTRIQRVLDAEDNNVTRAARKSRDLPEVPADQDEGVRSARLSGARARLTGPRA